MFRLFAASALLLALVPSAPVVAQVPELPTDINDESWYSAPPQPAVVTPTQIIQAKAQQRAQQRMSRIASQQWYGFSPARPRTTATPFTGMYGASWQMPGVRPDAWTPFQRTTVLIVR